MPKFKKEIDFKQFVIYQNFTKYGFRAQKETHWKLTEGEYNQRICLVFLLLVESKMRGIENVSAEKIARVLAELLYGMSNPSPEEIDKIASKIQKTDLSKLQNEYELLVRNNIKTPLFVKEGAVEIVMRNDFADGDGFANKFRAIYPHFQRDMTDNSHLSSYTRLQTQLGTTSHGPMANNPISIKQTNTSPEKPVEMDVETTINSSPSL